MEGKQHSLVGNGHLVRSPAKGGIRMNPLPSRTGASVTSKIIKTYWRIMNIKESPNYKIYIQVLRQISPEKRLLKAFELSEFTRQLFIYGLRKRFTNLSDEEFKKLLLERLDKCHNRNY